MRLLLRSQERGGVNSSRNYSIGSVKKTDKENIHALNQKQ